VSHTVFSCAERAKVTGEESIGLGISDEEAAVSVAFLKHRRDNLRTIIDANRAEFSQIKTWSLFP
jgi:hypothetical protein